MSARRRRRIVVSSILAVVLAAVLVWGIGVARVTRDLLANVRDVQGLMDDPGAIDTDTAGSLLLDVRSNVVKLDRCVGWLAPIAGKMGWVPRVGPLLAQAPPLMELADSLTELGVLMWRDLAPVLALYEQGVGPADLMPDAARALVVDQGVKADLAARAAQACGVLDVATIPDRFSDEAGMACDMMPLLASGMRAVDALPRLLGLDRPNTYLVLALNEDELRPGGGFITGVGEVQVVAGRLASVDFRDSYQVDDFSLPYPDPPAQFHDFMGIDLWVFRDSNWSPDFPTSAERAISLYRPGHPVEVDGVIALDQTSVQQFIYALGALWIPGVPEPVTGDSFFDYVHQTWAPDDGDFDGDWWRQRKSFMADVAQAALVRLEAGDIDVSTLATAALSMLRTRHLQVYVRDPSAVGFLREQEWDGALRDASADFLMMVEANLGYNKVSANITRSVRYEVDLRGTAPSARLQMDYQHQGQAAAACVPVIGYDPSYAEMMERCYWAYVRTLVPRGARLMSATETPITPDEIFTGITWPGQVDVTELAAYTALGQGFLLPAASSRQLTYMYELPADVARITADGSMVYDLLIQKQAGVHGLDVDIVLHLPENAVLLDVHPDVSSYQGGVLLFSSQSDADIEISVHYHLK